MEPITVMVATGAIALGALKLRRTLPSELTLPKLLDCKDINDASLIEVVAVHLQSAELAPCYAGRRLVAEVKYGSPGESASCESSDKLAARVAKQTGAEELAAPSQVELHQSCLFLRQRGPVPLIRIRLRTPHLGRAFGKAELTLNPGERCLREKDLLMWGTGLGHDEAIGKVRISVETRIMTKGSMQDLCHLVGAHQSKDGVLVGCTPFSAGEVAGDARASGGEQIEAALVAETDAPLHMGVPVAVDGLGIRPLR
jgi:hypothetical protein